MGCQKSLHISNKSSRLTIFFLIFECRNVSKPFLTTIIWWKNSISNWVSKLRPPSFIISITNIPLQLCMFYHYTLEKHFREWYIFSVFYCGRALSSSLAGSKSKIFYNLSWTTLGELYVSLTKVNSTHKTQSCKQKVW